ncbi:MAG TPA: PEP-CTERM sorting domain-containing protein [Planctomycetaceae bacterium]
MTASRIGRLIVIALPLGLATPDRAGAGVIVSLGPVSFPGVSAATIGPIGNNPAPNNDNATAPSPNTVPFTIVYDAVGVGATDVEFIVNASGGTTEYLFTQTLVNNTNRPWTDFHFELGFGIGAGFVRSGSADSLDFDTPDRDPAPASSAFAALDHQADTLDWDGGLVPVGGTVLLSFSVDVPDGLSGFNPSGLNRFTLRQVPTVAPTPIPEPGSLALMSLGGLGLVGGAIRKRRRATPAA